MNSSYEVIEFNGHQINLKAFRENLICWGKIHFRFFPWRYTRDPYKILVAEIMLKRIDLLSNRKYNIGVYGHDLQAKRR